MLGHRYATRHTYLGTYSLRTTYASAPEHVTSLGPQSWEQIGTLGSKIANNTARSTAICPGHSAARAGDPPWHGSNSLCNEAARPRRRWPCAPPPGTAGTAQSPAGWWVHGPCPFPPPPPPWLLSRRVPAHGGCRWAGLAAARLGLGLARPPPAAATPAARGPHAAHGGQQRHLLLDHHHLLIVRHDRRTIHSPSGRADAGAVACCCCRGRGCKRGCGNCRRG